MPDPSTSLLGGVAIFAGLFAVHELGHYLAGAVAGIPATDRRLVVLALPPHVALADDGEWVSPFETDRFAAAYGQYDPDGRYSVLFTAGGLVAQTVTAATVGVTAHTLAPDLAADVVWTSLWFFGGLLLVDVVVTTRRQRPFSDVSHLWRLDPTVALATCVLVVGVHAATLLWLP